MTVERALRRLAPLMPREVQQWRASLPLLSEHRRSLLEKHIQERARCVFGAGWEHQLLLPPPPATIGKGPLSLGRVVYPRYTYRFGLSRGELLQGLGLFGRSGAGKTNACLRLVQELSARGIPFLFLDWKRTARHLLPLLARQINVYTPGRSLSPFVFNPLIPPPGLETRAHILRFVDALAAAYTLGDGAKSLLQQVLSELYERCGAKLWPVIDDVVEALDAREVTGRAASWKVTAVRALQSLSFSLPSHAVTVRDQQEMTRRLLRQSTVIELDTLSDNAKQFLVPILMQWLFFAQLNQEKREQLRLVVIVEEAHHLLFKKSGRASESVMGQMLRQGRELGIGFVVVDQHPSLISQAALGNLYATVTFSLREPSDIARGQVLSGLQDEDRRHLSRLPVGQGIVKLADRWKEPFLVQFDHVPVKKGAMTDEKLRDYIARKTLPRRNTSLSGSRRAGESGSGTFGHFPPSDGPSAEVLALVRDCTEHPTDGVAARYERLEWGASKGERVKHDAVAAGMLRTGMVEIGRSRKRVLLPTIRSGTRGASGEGGAVAGHERKRSSGQESVEHEYWKLAWAERLRKDGWKVMVEAPRVGGWVDVLAERGGKRVGVEVESGKSDVVSNVQKALESGNRVNVVATNEKARRRVEKKLAEAGLLEGQHVSVMLRDEGITSC